MTEDEKMIDYVSELTHIIIMAMAEYCMKLVENDGLDERYITSIAVSSYVSSLMKLMHSVEHENIDESIQRIIFCINGLHDTYKCNESYVKLTGNTIN